MALKIKWNDDRVKAAATAVLLIGRDRLARGERGEIVAPALAEYRADPDTFKENRKAWPDARDTSSLTNPKQVEIYTALVADTDRLLARWAQAKRQFNSLLELDNALVAALSGRDS